MIHSSAEKDYKSVNTITFDAIRQAAALFGKATFVMDRGYDDNKMFLILGQLKQDYVIRLNPTGNFFITTNGQRQPNCGTGEKEKSKRMFSIREKSIPHIFPT